MWCFIYFIDCILFSLNHFKYTAVTQFCICLSLYSSLLRLILVMPNGINYVVKRNEELNVPWFADPSSVPVMSVVQYNAPVSV